ncbi:MAG: hypothetical protein ACLTD8_08070 [Acutalibacteraceae bacterium]
MRALARVLSVKGNEPAGRGKGSLPEQSALYALCGRSAQNIWRKRLIFLFQMRYNSLERVVHTICAAIKKKQSAINFQGGI